MEQRTIIDSIRRNLQERNDLIALAYEAELSLRQIAGLYGLSFQRVSQILKSRGVKTRDKSDKKFVPNIESFNVGIGNMPTTDLRHAQKRYPFKEMPVGAYFVVPDDVKLSSFQSYASLQNRILDGKKFSCRTEYKEDGTKEMQCWRVE